MSIPLPSSSFGRLALAITALSLPRLELCPMLVSSGARRPKLEFALRSFVGGAELRQNCRAGPTVQPGPTHNVLEGRYCGWQAVCFA